MSSLFTPLKIRDLNFRNRIFVSPMCQYSCVEGVPTNWHLVHLGSRAVGGASLVIAEATGVSPEGRISPGDTGLWNDEQMRAFQPLTLFIKEQGARAGIQLAHAGRKASTAAPWLGGQPLTTHQGGWTTWAPSATPFAEGFTVPLEMSREQIRTTLDNFVGAATRSLAAGFEVVELHMAHGYLLNQFLSPITNQRTDEYGGSRENRMRFPLEVARAVRSVWPDSLPLFARISATDWTEGGWTMEDSLALAIELKKIGVDLIDCSSGGISPHAKVPVGPGYQVPFAESIRRNSGVKTAAVGLITEPHQAEEIIREEKADAVLLAREFLRDPYWPLHAAQTLKVDVAWPRQYERAKPQI